jgi:O-antigen/teichoic acid export membrane protein
LGTSQIKNWIRLAAAYGVATASIRLMAAASSIILVRALSVENYAFFTVLLTTFTFACTFSDLGSTESVAYFRRRALQRKRAWDGYVSAVRRLRTISLMFAFVLAIAYFLWVTRSFGRAVSETTLAVVALVAAAVFATSASIWIYLLRLEGGFNASYVAEASNETAKLTVALAMLWFSTNQGTVAFIGILLGSAMLFAVSRRSYRKLPLSREKRSGRTESDRRRFRVLMGQARHVYPVALYFAIQGPFIIWIAAEFGGLRVVGELGALGRVSAILAAAAGFVVAVIVPRLSNISDDARFRAAYFRILAMLLTYAAVVPALTWYFADYILLILGSNYAGLQLELSLVVASGVVSTIVVFLWQVSRIRGWLRWQTLRIPMLIVVQIGLVSVLDLSSLSAVLLLSLATFAVDAAMQFAINIHGLREKTYRRVVS